MSFLSKSRMKAHIDPSKGLFSVLFGAGQCRLSLKQVGCRVERRRSTGRMYPNP